VHGSLLFTPGGEEKLYYSTGFGINFQAEALSIELNYTPIVKKGKYDHGVEFAINYGID
jgi:outer membrane protein assembly factor BamA